MSRALLLNAAASGAAGGDTVYVDDVFSTHIDYSESWGPHTATTGLDMSGEGGMVWTKPRASGNHSLYDTERGATKHLSPDQTSAEATVSLGLTSFTSTGFKFDTSHAPGPTNSNVWWSWRKQEKFFDIVTYTGNGTAGRTVSHNLGCVPGMIIIKQLNSTSDWLVYHRSLSANNKAVWLNKYDAETSYGFLNNTDPTATQITLGDRAEANGNNNTFVMYLFAHAPNSSFRDETAEYYANGSNISGFYGSGEYRIYSNSGNNTTYYNAGSASGSVSGANKFREIEAAIETATGQKVRTGPQKGTSGNATFYSIITLGADSSPFDDEESFITCGSYEGNGSTNGPVVNLGFEPQWLLIKNIDSGVDGMHWYIFDNMRGIVNGGENVRLKANKIDADAGEGSSSIFDVSPTGFQINATSGSYNSNGATFIYMAIRRPNKPASEFAATDLFAIDTKGGTSPTPPAYVSGFPVDMELHKNVNGSGDWKNSARLIQGKYLEPNNTDAQATDANMTAFDFQNGFRNETGTTSTSYAWMWRRAPGFFDVVAYTGDGTSTSFSHSLGVTPELKIIKIRGDSFGWLVGGSAVTGGTDDYQMYLNTNAGKANTNYWGSVDSASAFSVVAGNYLSNVSGQSYIAYLFASVDGISKVGTFSRTQGNTTNVDCGFSNGARFVLIKRTNTSGHWVLWDSTRGIVAGNDPYVLLSSNNAQVTNLDYIDPLSSGFSIQGGIATGDWIFYAIA